MDGQTVGMLGLCLAIAPQVPVGELWWPDLIHLKSKELVGIVSVHNCSLRRPDHFRSLTCVCTNTLRRFLQGTTGGNLAVSLSIGRPFSWLLKPNQWAQVHRKFGLRGITR